CSPTIIALYRLKHHLEAIRQVGQHMVVVVGLAVVGVEDRGGTADQHGTGYELLQPGCGLQHRNELRIAITDAGWSFSTPVRHKPTLSELIRRTTILAGPFARR